MGNCYNAMKIDPKIEENLTEKNGKIKTVFERVLDEDKEVTEPDINIDLNQSWPIRKSNIFDKEEFSQNGMIYKGKIVDGYLEDEMGYFKYKNIFQYYGGFKQGLFSGNGKVVWSNNQTYIGDFQLGKFHGKGTYSWPDGRKFIGEYRFGLKHGNGKIFFDWNKSYEGKWKNGTPYDKGVFYTDNKVSMRGEWINGKFIKLESK
jgi:hypothetical protein